MELCESDFIQVKGRHGELGARISKAELMIFYNIHHLRVMDSMMIRQMYRELVYTGVNSKQIISNRLGTLVKRKILIRDEVQIISDDPFGRRFYRLSTSGYQALAEAGLLEEQMITSSIRSAYMYLNRNIESKQMGNISAHTLTVTKFVFKVVADWHRQHGLKPLVYKRGAVGESIYEHNLNEYSIIPDYIFMNDNRIVFLENDTGTQGTNVLNKKLEKYAKLILDINKSYPDNDLNFHILFSVVDKTIYKQQQVNAASRVGTIKATRFPVSMWPTNMRVFVETAERAVGLSLNVLNGVDVSGEIEKDRAITNMTALLKYNLSNEELNFEVEEIDSEIFFKSSSFKISHLPRIVRIQANGEQRLLFVTYIEPGDVKDYHQANRVDRMLHAYHREPRAFNMPTEFYNVYLYRYSEQMKLDDLKVESGLETRMLSLEDLKTNWKSNFEFEWYAMRTARTKTLEKGFFI